MKKQPNNNDKLTGKACRRMRRMLELYQSDVGKHIGTTAAMVYYYESGKVAIPTERLQKMADMFGVSISSLLPPVVKKQRAKI